METVENRCRVLIVDDQEPMRLLLAHYVSEDLHAEISLAGTCEEAVRLADQKTYDIILLDLLMPGIGGFEVLKSIRAFNSVNRSTPVIVVSILVTSLAGEGGMAYDHAVELGANAFVQKPVTRSALIAAMKAALAKAKVDAKD
jgi:two-component system, OmpR family, response regulator ResD